MGGDQNININMSVEGVDSNPLDDFEGFKTSVEEVIAGVVETVRELELEVEPKDMTELLQSHDETLTDVQRKWFLDMESSHDEDAVNIVEMTAKGFGMLYTLS
jgi:hypothetical protein